MSYWSCDEVTHLSDKISVALINTFGQTASEAMSQKSGFEITLNSYTFRISYFKLNMFLRWSNSKYILARENTVKQVCIYSKNNNQPRSKRMANTRMQVYQQTRNCVKCRQQVVTMMNRLENINGDASSGLTLSRYSCTRLQPSN